MASADVGFGRVIALPRRGKVDFVSRDGDAAGTGGDFEDAEFLDADVYADVEMQEF